jgi:hypothetical protein
MLVGFLGEVGPRLGWLRFGPPQSRCQHNQQGQNALVHSPSPQLEHTLPANVFGQGQEVTHILAGTFAHLKGGDCEFTKNNPCQSLGVRTSLLTAALAIAGPWTSALLSWCAIRLRCSCGAWMESATRCAFSIQTLIRETPQTIPFSDGRQMPARFIRMNST